MRAPAPRVRLVISHVGTRDPRPGTPGSRSRTLGLARAAPALTLVARMFARVAPMFTLAARGLTLTAGQLRAGHVADTAATSRAIRDNRADV